MGSVEAEAAGVTREAQVAAPLPAPRIGVWGVFGTGNFGNEATAAGLLARLRRDGMDPVLLCERPTAAAAVHGAPALRLGAPVTRPHGDGRLSRLWHAAANRARLLAGAVARVRGLDAVVLAGTGSFERLGSGAWGVPYEMWSVAVACRVLRRPLVVLDVGAEHLPRALARAFVRSVARSAAYRSYRDDASRHAMVVNGVDAHGDVVATDLAFGLDVAPSRARHEDGTVLVGVMDYQGRDDTQGHGPSAEYRRRVVVTVDALRRRGLSVTLVGGDDVDLEFARSLDLGDQVPLVAARTPQELVDVAAAASVTVATRYHTVIMSLLARTPVVSIGYGEKHRAVLLQLGLDDTHRDVESFDPREVAALVDDLRARRDDLVPRIDEGVRAARARLDAQWPDVARLLTSRRGARA